MYRTRHECEDSDEMSGYGWLRHDGVRFGRQELLDEGYLITTSFMKDPEDRDAFREYVHVCLTDASEEYFGFEYEGYYYVYSTLSFGWKASPFIYNTLSGAVAQFFRRLGIRNLFYLDDSIYLPRYIPLAGPLRSELTEWLGLGCWHGTQTWRSERHVTIAIETDSSGRRWGGRIIVGSLEYRAWNDWSASDQRLHINLLEIMAFYNVLLSFRQHLAGAQVDCYIDNRSAMYNLINGGGRSLEMTDVAKLIFLLQRADNVDIVYHWIASEFNTVADAISREESPLRLRPALFQQLDRAHGGFLIDLLSSGANRQQGFDGRDIPFFSRYACPGSTGVNVFAQPIPTTGVTFANPPFILIGPLLGYLRSQRSLTVTVVPQYDQGRVGQYWWPLILEAALSWTLLSAPFAPSPFERRGRSGGSFAALPPSPVAHWAVLLDFRFL
ncbi:Reverse transcriptase [Klebsormidium nitens]|uniref:Reverse transcriptase n=1 Tax=Klebsormidium nitens TaxID=105231 RepID=A0A1Y1IR01_KLENI|nr:Reverse transcriptase [Klebsormidium nitens]|eukprot:GAQ91057.1 Reverse transcriptase [Klebsormidium nitens]